MPKDNVVDENNTPDDDIQKIVDNVLDNPQTTVLDEDVREEIASLRRRNEELETELRSKGREVEKYKSDAERESGKGKKAIAEKRETLDKLNVYRDLHKGISNDVATELFEKYRNGGDDNEFEREKERIIGNRIEEWKEQNYVPLLDEVQEYKDLNVKLRGKLVDSVIRTEIIQNAMKFGVHPDLSTGVVHIFESRMKIDDDGDRVYLNKDGTPTSIWNWGDQMRDLKAKSPSYFRTNKGSGAVSASEVASTDPNYNPFAVHGDRVGQMRLRANDPERAKKLKAAARLAKKSKA